MDAKDRAMFINSVSAAAPQPAAPQSDTRAREDIKTVVQPKDEESVFAAGLPDWDIIPPQVVVRRKRRV